MNPFVIENLQFEKYHGLGNDYIIINDIHLDIPEEKKSNLARALCQYHFSVGADGLIFVCNSIEADIKMRIFNSDGSEAEMCGNGIRCFSKYVYENNIVKKSELSIETLKGIIIAELNIREDLVESVKIDMGPPILDCEMIPVDIDNETSQCINEELVALDKIFRFSAVSMGNPHTIIFIKEQLDDTELNKYGSVIESHKYFPNKTNVEFVKVVSNEEAILRVFERGVGITNSCGTGTCAAVVAGTELGLFKKNSPITIHNDGGDLIITYTRKTIFMEGPVVKVFVGNIEKLMI
ncbi:MAG: diaminopimelate epimerase [Promethearchaeota archaeon]